jgi:hypothetical protein
MRKLYHGDLSAIDAILGVNEQVQTIQLFKTIPPEEKLY